MQKVDVGALIAEHETTFEFDGHTLPYLYCPCRNPAEKHGLLVSFGSWGGIYNRIRGFYEIENEHYDMLWLQDNHGHENKGVWYLAEDGDFWVESAYTALLEEILVRSGVERERVGFFGSSMGGFAALYFGFDFQVGKIVAICPLIGVQARYRVAIPEVLQRIQPDPDFDLDGYLLQRFEQTIPTETHIIYCQADDKLTTARFADLARRLIEQNNAFVIESLPMECPGGEHPHNAPLKIMDREEIMARIHTPLYRAQPQA